MFKLLYADSRKLLYHSGMREGLITIAGYLVGYTLLMKIIAGYMGSDIVADDIHTAYRSVGILFITACTLMTMVSDFTDGCIRNKLISGARRSEVFLSAEIIALFEGVILTASACVISFILSLLFTKGGLQTMTAAELADHWLISTMSSVAVSVFSTMLIMLLGGNKLSYIVGMVLAIGTHIFNMEVIDKLYPETGLCTLTGAKLAFYRFYDSYVPYAYLSMRQHNGMMSYTLGSIGTILISLIAGLVLFSRKEIA